MKKYWCLLVLIISLQVPAAHAEKSLTKAFLTQPIIRTLVGEGCKKTKSSDANVFSYRCNDDEDPYNVDLSVLEYFDYDADGVMDVLILNDSMGALGGNVHTTASLLYILLNHDGSIKAQHELLMYAPFSYNVLEDPLVKNAVLIVKATQNRRTYDVAEGDLESTHLSFRFVNGVPYEDSYLTQCALAKMLDKRIIRDDLSSVQHFTSFDMHDYTQTQEDTLETSEFKLVASLQGCDNLQLRFNLSLNQGALDAQTLDHGLDVLLQNTVYPSVIQAVKRVVQNSKKTANSWKGGEGSSEKITLNGTWEFSLLFSQEKDQTLSLRLSLNKTDNPKQQENWDVTTRAH